VSTRLLETTLHPFPDGTEDYVTHAVLKDYIQATAFIAGVHEVTQYDTEVRKVSKSGKSWSVETATLHTNDSGETIKKSASFVSFDLK
jgi:hypothetical protein